MRVGYYVSTDYYEEQYREMETPPNPPLIDKYATALLFLVTAAQFYHKLFFVTMLCPLQASA